MTFTIEEDYSGFDWDTTDGDGRPEPLPKGAYPVRIEKAEIRTFEGREGPFRVIKVQMRVLEGHEHAGRVIFDDIFLGDHPTSRQRRAIIWRRLGLVQKGAGKVSVSEAALVGIECEVDVGIETFDRKQNGVKTGEKGTKNKVAFAGYRLTGKPASDGPEAGPGTAPPDAQLSEEDVPF